MLIRNVALLRFEYLFLKIDKDLGICIFRGFCGYFGAFIVLIALDLELNWVWARYYEGISCEFGDFP